MAAVQQGRDLGQRLHRAFDDLFARGHPRVVVVGSDIPDLAADDVRLAGEKLRERPVVLGPAEDGGYYLIGQRRPGAELFTAVRWGSRVVWWQTLRKVKDLGLPFGLLPPLYDVDRLEDFLRYQMSKRRHRVSQRKFPQIPQIAQTGRGGRGLHPKRASPTGSH